MKLFKLFTLLITAFIIFAPLQATDVKDTKKGAATEYVVFDLGGVVFDTDTYKTISHIGFSNCAWGFKSLIQGRTRMFKVLTAIKPHIDGQQICIDETGNQFPQIMCDWMQGTPSNEILETIKAFIDKDTTMLTASEKKLYRQIFTIIFTPEIFVETRCFYQEALQLAQWCKDRGLKLYGLSNWNKEAFDLIKKRYPEFFNLFEKDCFICSGDVKCMKPSKDIFDYAQKQWQKADREFTMNKAVFIDDQQENCAQANKNGMRSIHIHKKRWGSEPDLQRAGNELAALCNFSEPIIATPYKISTSVFLASIAAGIGTLWYLNHYYTAAQAST